MRRRRSGCDRRISHRSVSILRAIASVCNGGLKAARFDCLAAKPRSRAGAERGCPTRPSPLSTPASYCNTTPDLNPPLWKDVPFGFEADPAPGEASGLTREDRITRCEARGPSLPCGPCGVPRGTFSTQRQGAETEGRDKRPPSGRSVRHDGGADPGLRTNSALDPLGAVPVPASSTAALAQLAISDGCQTWLRPRSAPISAPASA